MNMSHVALCNVDMNVEVSETCMTDEYGSLLWSPLNILLSIVD